LWQPLLLLLSGSSLLFFPLFAWVYLEAKMATMMVFIFSIYLISKVWKVIKGMLRKVPCKIASSQAAFKNASI
jgi:hypothetical protein